MLEYMAVLKYYSIELITFNSKSGRGKSLAKFSPRAYACELLSPTTLNILVPPLEPACCDINASTFARPLLKLKITRSRYELSRKLSGSNNIINFYLADNFF